MLFALARPFGPVRLDPDPVLRQPCHPVFDFDDALGHLAIEMVATMRRMGGVGLAAPQIGCLQRICVVELPGWEQPAVLVNPEVISVSAKEVEGVESCLSIPDQAFTVLRPFGAVVQAQKLDGELFEVHLDGQEARVVLHEVDHLAGRLINDRR